MENGQMCMCCATHKSTHTRAHTHTHTYIHAHTRTYIHRCVCATQMCMCYADVFVLRNAQAHTCTSTQTHTRAHTHIIQRKHSNTRKCSDICTYIYTHTNKQIHTCMQTHTHTHTYAKTTNSWFLNQKLKNPSLKRWLFLKHMFDRFCLPTSVGNQNLSKAFQKWNTHKKSIAVITPSCKPSYIYVCMSFYVCVYVCMYVCMYVCVSLPRNNT